MHYELWLENLPRQSRTRIWLQSWTARFLSTICQRSILAVPVKAGVWAAAGTFLALWIIGGPGSDGWAIIAADPHGLSKFWMLAQALFCVAYVVLLLVFIIARAVGDQSSPAMARFARKSKSKGKE